MKNLIYTLIFTTIFMSCGSDPEYPITYTFDKQNEISSVVLTENVQGLVIEIDKFQSIENLGLSTFEFFTSVAPLQTFKSVTVDSETDLTVDFGIETPLGQIVSLPYTGNEFSEFGLIIEEDQIRQRGCYDFTLSPLASLNANICDKDNASAAGNELFLNSGFGINDTLAYSIIEGVYLRQK